MDEQRVQAYLSLIQELLDCPGGEENDILNRHLELVDEEFVQMCAQVAAKLQEEGRKNDAGFLRNVAQEVEAFLRRGETQGNATPNQYLQFWMQVLRAISSSNGNPAVVYPLFTQNLDKLDLNLAQILRAWTKDKFSQLEAKQAKSIAAVIVNFANLIQQFPLGRRAEKLEIAIACYEAALEVYTPSAYPENWAATQNNLGLAYFDRLRGERAENLEQAINCLEATLEVSTRSAYPEEWARSQNNLGLAYSNRLLGERAENLEIAIACFQGALEVSTRSAYPEEWATTQNNLGNAYSDRLRGERAENLEKAITCFKSALEVLTRSAYPEEWARSQNNLGLAYWDRRRGKRAENLEKAIACLEVALEVRTRNAYPEKWATTQNNLGIAYSNRVKGEGTQNLEKAISLFQEALEIRTRTAFPQNYTETLNNLGFAYQKQSQHYTHDRDKKQTALQNAYTTFDQALDTVELLRGEITSGDEAKRKLNEEWNKVYRGMVEVCLELGRYTDAMEYADRSKARNLVELIATRDAYPGGEIPKEVRQQLQQLRQAISEEERRLQQNPSPDYTHISQLRQEKQEIEPYQPLHFQAMQELLDEETAILEWYILPDKFLTFTLTRHRLKLWRFSEEDLKQLGDWGNTYLTAYYQAKETQQKAIEALKAAQTEAEKQQVESLLKEAQDIWQNPLAQRLEQLPQILHLDEVLDNLFKNFPTCKKLILIPHLFLHLFPLHALPVSLPSLAEKGAGGEGKFLQDLFPKGVTYAPNCQLLQQAQNRTRFNFNRLLAIQNPTKELAWADMQVETIRQFFPQRKTLGESASKAKFLAQDLSQTHHLFFSCHGRFYPTSPLDSGLQLADGVLTLQEIIAQPNLSECSLVTLSACETGQVAIDQTDEYISIASGFILAGSPSVLMSLWSVDEASTALLLIKTYELLHQQPGQLVIALKDAQTWLRDTTNAEFHAWVQQCSLLSKDWREFLAERFQIKQNEEGANFRPYKSPYHWAAFCVVGQGEQKMARDREKIEAFKVLLSEGLDSLLAPYRQDLNELQLADDDEQSVQAIETWLADRQPIYQAYQEQLKTLTLNNPLLGTPEEMSIGGSKVNTKGSTLKESLENAQKRNTEPPPPPHKSE